jgi:hypothetical protein
MILNHSSPTTINTTSAMNISPMSYFPLKSSSGSMELLGQTSSGTTAAFAQNNPNNTSIKIGTKEALIYEGDEDATQMIPPVA